jgi:molecular chaperone GrpE
MAPQDEQLAGTATPSEAPPPAEADAATPSETAPIEEQLRAAEQRATEHHDAWLRAMADADNIRRRSQAEIQNAHRFAIEAFAKGLLPVKDSLEAALSTNNATLDSLRSGVELTLKQLNAALESAKIAEVHPLEEKFDPHRHQAMGMIDSGLPPNTVAAVMQKGYLLHERVLRPALVMVSKPKTD